MKLDILTPKGQETLALQDYVISKILDKWGKEISVVETDTNKPSRIDFIITKNNILSALVELKCRKISRQDLLDRGGTWLISNHKIEDGLLLSKMFCVPFFGFLYLVNDNQILYWKISDDKGNKLFKYDVRRTKTSKSINGGEVIKDNAFLPLENSTIL